MAAEAIDIFFCDLHGKERAEQVQNLPVGGDDPGDPGSITEEDRHGTAGKMGVEAVVSIAQAEQIKKELRIRGVAGKQFAAHTYLPTVKRLGAQKHLLDLFYAHVYIFHDPICPFPRVALFKDITDLM